MLVSITTSQDAEKLENNLSKKIKSVAIAEDLKSIGLSETVKKISDGFCSLSIIKEGYKEFDEEEESNAYKAFKKTGFTVTLPYTLCLIGVGYLGTAGKVMLDSLREKKNIEFLKKAGYIKEGEEEKLIKKVNDINKAVDSGKLCASSNYSDTYTYATDFPNKITENGVYGMNGDIINEEQLGGRSK